MASRTERIPLPGSVRSTVQGFYSLSPEHCSFYPMHQRWPTASDHLIHCGVVIPQPVRLFWHVAAVFRRSHITILQEAGVWLSVCDVKPPKICPCAFGTCGRSLLVSFHPVMNFWTLIQSVIALICPSYALTFSHYWEMQIERRAGDRSLIDHQKASIVCPGKDTLDLHAQWFISLAGATSSYIFQLNHTKTCCWLSALIHIMVPFVYEVSPVLQKLMFLREKKKEFFLFICSWIRY